MMQYNAIKSVASYALFYRANAAFAHEGHGLQGSHWHTADVWGLVALGGAVAVAAWLSRGGKR